MPEHVTNSRLVLLNGLLTITVIGLGITLAFALFKSAAPSVVHITTHSVARDFFSLNIHKIPRGSGTGFVWDDLGHIVTNFHVIDGADIIYVSFGNQDDSPARLVGAAPEKDLAVLKIDIVRLDFARFRWGHPVIWKLFRFVDLAAVNQCCDLLDRVRIGRHRQVCRTDHDFVCQVVEQPPSILHAAVVERLVSFVDNCFDGFSLRQKIVDCCRHGHRNHRQRRIPREHQLELSSNFFQRFEHIIRPALASPRVLIALARRQLR